MAKRILSIEQKKVIDSLLQATRICLDCSKAHGVFGDKLIADGQLDIFLNIEEDRKEILEYVSKLHNMLDASLANWKEQLDAAQHK